ncbi:LacI family DNA-binding transcriptional regulator [Streptomyces sp. NPDC088354]|uniref:LacI family DNA-binding transcriptional regulator n=1 Tax=unclassified Streptomyces TaxID=2593676 RepID=UPI0029BA2834|nr:LacI family DNA-binding transcriptional regulator [Streptomyces sp. MI02-7b]MDX3075383.1 LacI family DNA-binding transcriptional regulator [Streptomyces sp. MI02-7b]
MTPAPQPPGPTTRTRRPTLDAVAARAGVGRGTVSRVINGSSHVSPQARAAVERAIAELAYVPNRAARSLVTRRTDSIALVIPESETRLFSEPYFSAIIRGVSAGLTDADMQLLLVLARDEHERNRLASYLTAQRVDGALMVAVHRDDTLPDLLTERGIPTVLAGRRTPDEPLPHVHADNEGGAHAAVQHLIDQGRRTIATITGPLDMEAAQARLTGYRTALHHAGITVDEHLIAHGDFTEQRGQTAMHELLNRRPHLDAVFAASDVTATGAILALRTTGHHIPHDIAIIGFDDSTIARHTDPPLTTIRQPTQHMGHTMATLLLHHINQTHTTTPNHTTPNHHVTLPTQLIIRHTT